jgi:hypothetical protein
MLACGFPNPEFEGLAASGLLLEDCKSQPLAMQAYLDPTLILCF